MPFYPAEAYHQNFATLHPDNLYIAEIDAPKVTRSRSCSRRFIARARRRCASLRMVRGLR